MFKASPPAGHVNKPLPPDTEDPGIPLPAALQHRDHGAIWTTTKVLRRLAWHERGELVVMRELEGKAHRALGLA
jgi:hypothetical protein